MFICNSENYHFKFSGKIRKYIIPLRLTDVTTYNWSKVWWKKFAKKLKDYQESRLYAYRCYLILSIFFIFTLKIKETTCICLLRCWESGSLGWLEDWRSGPRESVNMSCPFLFSPYKNTFLYYSNRPLQITTVIRPCRERWRWRTTALQNTRCYEM